MGKMMFNVGRNVCEECSLALRRFIGHMEGVESVDVEEAMTAVVFNEAKITAADISRITTDSLEKLGYKEIA